ncbi:MAG: hypothetical protein WCJ61_01005 [Paludibacter sp.]|jgi:hypothetical protein
MKTLTTLKILFVAFFLVASISTLSAQTLIAGWDFQTTTTGGVQILASPNTQTLFPANFGTGNLYLDGTNGSSTFYPSSYENGASTGVAYNTGDGFSANTTNPASLVIARRTSASPVWDTNGKSVVFKFSMTGLKDLILTHALFRHGSATDNTSFTNIVYSYSIDGSNWTQILDDNISGLYGATYYGTKLSTIPATGAITGLDNAATAYIKLTVSGATGTSNYSNIRLDNIKLKAGSITTGMNVENQNSNLVYKSNNGLLIKSYNASTYEVYSISGQKLAKGNLQLGVNQINLNVKGIVLVQINGNTTKIEL